MRIDRHAPREINLNVTAVIAPFVGVLLCVLAVFMAAARCIEDDLEQLKSAASDPPAAGAGPQGLVTTTAEGRLVVSQIGYTPADLPRTDGARLSPRRVTRPAIAEPARPLVELALPPAEPAHREVRPPRTLDPRPEIPDLLSPLSPLSPVIEPSVP
jgi:hypothetical protein